MGDSTVNYIDRDLVEVLTMSNSWGTCNCFFTTRESREVLEKIPEWGLTSSSRLNLGVITYRSFIIAGDSLHTEPRPFGDTLIYNMNGVEGTVSGPMEDLMEYDRDAAGLVEYIAALNQGDRDIREEIDLTFKTTGIWGDEMEEHWHFRPCVGGYVVDGPSGERFTERSFELTKMLFKRYVGWCKSHSNKYDI
jgi:hypothetical protein